MFCPNCGTRSENEQRFCKKCGEYLGDSFDSQTGDRQPIIAPLQGNSGSSKRLVKTDWSYRSEMLLILITCGIYGLYRIHSVAEETNVICEGDGETTPGVAVYMLLCIVTLGIYGFYWTYKVQMRLIKAKARYDWLVTKEDCEKRLSANKTEFILNCACEMITTVFLDAIFICSMLYWFDIPFMRQAEVWEAIWAEVKPFVWVAIIADFISWIINPFPMVLNYLNDSGKAYNAFYFRGQV